MNDRARSFGLLILRLSGLYLAFGHGHGKIASLMHGEAQGFIDGVASMGFPQPVLFAWAAACAEFFGGLLVTAGLLTRVGAAFAAFNLLVAAFLRHHAHQQLLGGATPEQMKEWGKPELAIVYALAMLCLVFTGPGKFSIDAMISRRMGRD